MQVAVDIVIFGYDGQDVKIMLVKRKGEPYHDKYALPGGLVRDTETCESCARRTLSEKLAIDNLYIEQLGSFDAVHRDPRERIISVAYFSIIRQDALQTILGRGVSDVIWENMFDIKKIAFDHNEIIHEAIKRVQGKLAYEPIAFELLNKKFALSEVQKIYETFYNQEIDKRNFRKKILALNILKISGNIDRAGRTPFMYSIDKKEFNKIKNHHLIELTNLWKK
jgi:8-oxo-dGTP diphosphatase